MITATCPLDKTVQVTKKFIEATAKPTPPFMKRHQMLVTTNLSSGLKYVSIYEVDDTKFKEATIEFTKRFVPLYEIEGYRYEIEPMLTAEEALPLIGIK